MFCNHNIGSLLEKKNNSAKTQVPVKNSTSDNNRSTNGSSPNFTTTVYDIPRLNVPLYIRNDDFRSGKEISIVLLVVIGMCSLCSLCSIAAYFLRK
jgi:hypothetical protein